MGAVFLGAVSDLRCAGCSAGGSPLLLYAEQAQEFQGIWLQQLPAVNSAFTVLPVTRNDPDLQGCSLGELCAVLVETPPRPAEVCCPWWHAAMPGSMMSRTQQGRPWSMESQVTAPSIPPAFCPRVGQHKASSLWHHSGCASWVG